jgi:hypothetical protein
VNAIASGHVNDPAHADPEQSLELGLQWLKEPPSKRLKKMLKRKVLPLYELPPNELASDAVAITNSAFQSGKLKALGLDPGQKTLSNLPLPDRALLSKCATELLEYKYLLGGGLTAKSEFEYFTLFEDSLRRIKTAVKLSADFGELAKIEDVPDLQTLYPTIKNGLGILPKIRSKRRSVKFREWLSSATKGDAKITKEYIEAISDAKGPLDSRKGKFVKSLALATVGAVAGYAAEGAVPSAIAGSVIAQAAHPAVDFTLDLLDEFLLDGLRKGWRPRMFFDDLAKLERNSKQTT